MCFQKFWRGAQNMFKTTTTTPTTTTSFKDDPPFPQRQPSRDVRRRYYSWIQSHGASHHHWPCWKSRPTWPWFFEGPRDVGRWERLRNEIWLGDLMENLICSNKCSVDMFIHKISIFLWDKMGRLSICRDFLWRSYFVFFVFQEDADLCVKPGRLVRYGI